MAERIRLVGRCRQFADISSVCRLDSFGHGNDNGLFLADQFLDLFQKIIHIKGYFRQVDQIRAFTVFTLGQYCCSGEPSRISSHDLDDRHALHLIDQAVTYQFLGNGSNIFCRTSVTRRMIRTL